MKVTDLNLFIENILESEVKKTILSESKKEFYHIKCEGEPIATFDSKEKAEEQLPKYKETHPDKELIIEKGAYGDYSEMIDKLDEMGEELEEKENINMGTNKNTDIEMSEEKQTCNECGSEMKEGECMECGSKMNESSKKKKVLRLKESDLIKLIKNTISESVPGLTVTKSAQTKTKQESEENAREVAKKIEKATSFEGNDNPEFPKQIGKGEKMTRKPVENEEETIEDIRGGGMEDLNYEIEPSEMFKERQKMAIKGDTKMGNSHDAANVIKSDLPEKMLKKVERKKQKQADEPVVSWGHRWKSPTEVKVVNEEIERMKKLLSYNEKTQ